MKAGISTYSLLEAIESGEMDILDVLHWTADHGGEHVEIVPYGFTLVDNESLAAKVREKAEELGLLLSSYSMPADFVKDTEEEFEQEVDRVKKHVDLLHFMDIRHLRHDVTAFTLPPEKRTIEYFENNLPRMVEGSQRIADYAAAFSITTTIENHGMAVQHSDRVQRVLQAVNKPNFKTTLDIGNFMCVDEDPLVGVTKNLPYASLVHVKDFYIRPSYEDPGAGKWFKTANDNNLRGSIFGQGDLPVRELLKRIKQSGYDGFLTLEFEGMEECRLGTRIGLDNLKRLWEEL
ncbi:sugar phosphate isomerase/epimerase family protein [Alkalicoccobacillus gibsonii]|uniref:sugar phosphate isomerase/epimerase family protein n=1 Tax=Alkalicoccobacillus gibsonii TaxID=79881 RepID=UPI0019316A71|nr:sugar phosphate isomerase/epimerase family protein [Alkalicoccobacillus gibsonii]MBM0066937.1 sugar phosphate isomerase/epimerase [Alkalicoccobacillus gibsonii]